MATTSETTATTINDTWAIASFSKANEFLGFSSFDTSNVILTNRQSMSIYKVSDQQTVSSFTLKSESSFCLPVVYDHEEEHYVGLVENLGKRRLCVWTNKLSNYKDWKKKLLSTEVTELVEVEKTEPLVVTSNNCVCWLSHVEDTSRCVHLLPPDLRNADVEISQFKSYRWSNRTEIVYIVTVDGRHLVYKLQFNDKQVFGKSTQVFLNYTDVTSVCRVVPHAESNYIATSGKGEILYSTGTSEEVISSLNSQFSTQCVSLHLLDSDQLLIATSHSSTNTGVLLIFSIKFRTTRVLKTLASELYGDKPVTLLPPYILTHTESSLQAHSYKYSKLTLRSMMGSLRLSADSELTRAEELNSCMKYLETQAKNGQELVEELAKYDRSLLLEVVLSYTSLTSMRWSSSVVLRLLSYLTLPSQVVLAVADAAVRHADSDLVKYLTFVREELPEPVIVSLLTHYIKNIPQSDVTMDTDSSGHDSGILDIPSELITPIETLLSKHITDVYAVEAVRRMNFDYVLVLLKHLNTLLSDVRIPDADWILDGERMCRWCTVILDAHSTQLILSNQAQLLVSLHENIRRQVELHGEIRKLGAAIHALSKPPQSKPSAGRYSIEVVPFYC